MEVNGGDRLKMIRNSTPMNRNKRVRVEDVRPLDVNETDTREDSLITSPEIAVRKRPKRLKSKMDANANAQLERMPREKSGGGESRQRLGSNSEKKKEGVLPTLRRKVPRTTAVAITCLDERISYADILKKAREKVSLQALNIDSANIKRSMTGGVIIEIADDEEGGKADGLKEKLCEALESSKIRISRPMKKLK